MSKPGSVIEDVPKASLAYTLVTDKIVEMLEAGTVPWHKPWFGNGFPLSMSTGKPYRGINPFLLNMASMDGAYDSRWWGTFAQIRNLGGKVVKGEKSTLVVFWKTDRKTVTDDNGDEKTKRWSMLRYFRVFNTSQAEWPNGLPAKFAPPPLAEHDPIGDAQRILDDYIGRGPSLRFGGDAAYYSPADDRITMPVLGRFTTPEEFYSTAFHESTHSTGHRTRLEREGVQEHHYGGMPTYAKEELIAEMGAAMLSAQAGIEQVTIEQSAAYLASWLEILRGDPKMVVSAAGAAQKACDLILGTTFDQEDA